MLTTVLEDQKQSGAVDILKQIRPKNDLSNPHQTRLFVRLPLAFKKTGGHRILETEEIDLSKRRFVDYNRRESIEFQAIENLEQDCEMEGIENPVTTRLGYYTKFRSKFLVIVPVKTKYNITIPTDPHWKVIKENFEWDDFSTHGQETLLNKQIQFQCNTLELREMCYITEALNPQLDISFMKSLESSLICKLLKNGNQVTKIADFNFPKVPAHYTVRKIRTRNRISRTVLTVTKKYDNHDGDIFVFECPKLSLYNLVPFVERFGDGNCDNSGGQLKLRRPNVRCILLDTPTDFNEICKKAHPRPVHLLECVLEDTGTVKELHWKKSKGSVSNLQKYIHRLPEEFSEKRFYNDDGWLCNPVIISNAPGMGKSSLLAKWASHLEQSKESDDFVIVQFFILRDFIKKLHQFGSKSCPDYEFPSLETTSNYLASLTSPYCIGQLFFKSLLKSKMSNIDELPGKLKINIMFDGIDELESDDLDIAKFIIKGLSNYVNVHTWITSRPHLLESIEQYFEVLGYNISPLDENDQVNFLSNYWHSGNNICQQMYEIARTTLQQLKQVRSEADSSKDVAGTPLLCFLLAEIYKKEAHECQKQDLSYATNRRITDLSITILYEQYIDRTLRSCGTKDDPFLQHVEVALHILFPELQPPFILTEWKAGNVKNLLKYGIVQANSIADTCRFVHFTIAQYMVARGIIHIIECMSNNASTNNTLDTTSHRFQKFTTLIKKALSVKMASLQFSKFGEGSVKKHAQFKFANVCFFFNHSLDFAIKVENIMGKIEKNYNQDNFSLANNIWGSLVAAVTSNHFQIAKPLIQTLKFVVKNQKEVKQFFSKYPKNKVSDLIFLAAKYCSNDLFGLVCSLCLEWNEEIDHISEYIFECNLKISNNQINFLTPLHVSIEAGNYKVTLYLLQKANFLKSVKRDLLKYKFLLHFLLKNSIDDSTVTIQSKKEILKCLSDKLPDLFIKNKPSQEIILERINLELLLCFLKYRGKVQYLKAFYQNDVTTNKRGENMLHLLATGHYDSDMTPEKYHNALVQLRKVKPSLDIVSYLKATNHSGWRAADVACSFIDLLDKTLDLFESLGLFCYDKVHQQTATIFKAVAGQRQAVFLEKLINRNAVWNSRAYGSSILHVAASCLNYSAVNFFVNVMNQNVNEQDDEGNTPLHKCFLVELQTLMGNQEVNQMNETDINCQPPNLYSDPTQRFCDNTRMFSYNSQHSPHKNQVQTNIEREPSNQHKIISLLIEKGAAIDAKNYKNITPLDLALEISLGGLDEDERRTLVSARYNLFSCKENMTMALKGLLLNNQIGYLWHPSLIISFAYQLKRLGGNIQYRDPNDDASLVHLASKNHSYFGVKYLVEEEGLSPKLKDREDRSPILYMRCPDNCTKFNCKKLRQYLMNKVSIP